MKMRMKIMGKADQAAIAKYFSKKNSGLRYISGLGIALGSVNAGIMLSQLLYWHGKGKKKPWTYKSTEAMREETGLTRTQQDTAIQILKKHGIIETKLKGVPATRHYKVNLETLHQVLPSLKKTHKLTYPNPSNYYVENDESITKITRQTTSETAIAVNKNNFKQLRKSLINEKTARGP